MDNQIQEDPYRILARERSHEDARQTVATNRMLVQSLVIINGGAATAALAYYGEQLKNGQISGSLSLTPAWPNGKKSWKDTDCGDKEQALVDRAARIW